MQLLGHKQTPCCQFLLCLTSASLKNSVILKQGTLNFISRSRILCGISDGSTKLSVQVTEIYLIQKTKLSAASDRDGSDGRNKISVQVTD